VKYLVRVRNTEREVITERQWEYKNIKDAVRVKRNAAKAGFYSTVSRVLDREKVSANV